MGLNLTLLDVVICCVALAGSVAAGLFIALRRGSSESSSEFFLAGRRLTWPVVGASPNGSPGCARRWHRSFSPSA